jgi:hypothetical protein
VVSVRPTWLDSVFLQWGGAIIGAIIGVLSALGVVVAQRWYDRREKSAEFRFRVLAFLAEVEWSSGCPALPRWVTELESTPFPGCAQKYGITTELVKLKIALREWRDNSKSDVESRGKIAGIGKEIRERLGLSEAS